MADPQLDLLVSVINENVSVLKVFKNDVISKAMKTVEKADAESKSDMAKTLLAVEKSENDLITLVNAAFKQYFNSLDAMNAATVAADQKTEAKKSVIKSHVKFLDEEAESEVKVDNHVPTPPAPLVVLQMPESPILQSSYFNTSVLNSTRRFATLQMPRTPETLRKQPTQYEKRQMEPKKLNFDESAVDSSILK